jgi:hypothetical protein
MATPLAGSSGMIVRTMGSCGMMMQAMGAAA